VYELATYAYDNATDRSRQYSIDGRVFEENTGGDWYLYEAGSRGNAGGTDRLDLRFGVMVGVLTADFDGEAEVEGIPANHFVFDETDLASYSAYTPERPSPDVEGDFYLARDGNYVLASHSKESSPGRVYEVTEALSSVGELAEIVLPADLVPMRQALDLGVELSSLLPPSSSLSAMIRYKHGIGLDYYSYRASVANNEEFVNFYRTLPPTNGWKVTHIGHIKPHLEYLNCETDIECVILRNGAEQIVVSFGGGNITLEYDHQHIFTPA